MKMKRHFKPQQTGRLERASYQGGGRKRDPDWSTPWWLDNMQQLGSANIVEMVQPLSIVVTADHTHSSVASVMSGSTKVKCSTTGIR